MLARYPGLTVVGGLAMAFAVWIGAGTFELVGQWLYPRLPLPDADRIVGIELQHTASRDEESRVLHDFVTWHEELTSVEDLGAFRTVERNLFVSEGRAEPIEVVEISASAFRVPRVRPQLGRVLVESDELDGAPPVMVIGHEVWQTRFDADPGVIGRTVRLGNVQSTVVGVMPEEFAFPVSHEVWTPLRVNVLDYAHLEGPALRVLGRLARGATLDDAQTELDYMGLRAAADFPDTHEHLRPRVMPYAQSLGIETGHHVIVVNQTFVDRVLQSRNPIGRRVRFTNSGDKPAPWYEIIGVARDLGMNYLGTTSGNGAAGLYHPLAAGEAQRFGVHMAAKVRGDPASFASRLRAIAQAVDPTLRLEDLRPLDELDDGLFTVLAIFLRVTILTSSIALLLSLAGIYSVTSFAVSRRTREIGIRVALGANARGVMRAIFSRPLAQVGVGIVAGGGLVAAIARGFTGELSVQQIGLVIAYAALMLSVCMLACIVPARRALAVEPTEALNAEE